MVASSSTSTGRSARSCLAPAPRRRRARPRRGEPVRPGRATTTPHHEPAPARPEGPAGGAGRRGPQPPAATHPVAVGRPSGGAPGRGRRAGAAPAASATASPASAAAGHAVTATTPSAIRSIHHSPASPSASPPARQARPTGCAEQEASTAPRPVAAAEHQHHHRQRGDQPGGGPGRRELALDDPSGSRGRSRMRRGDPVEGVGQPAAGAVGDRPGGGDQPQVCRLRGCGDRSRERRRRGRRRARPPRRPGASTGHSSAARRERDHRRLAGDELGGDQLAGLEHPVGGVARPPRRRRRSVEQRPAARATTSAASSQQRGRHGRPHRHERHDAAASEQQPPPRAPRRGRADPGGGRDAAAARPPRPPGPRRPRQRLTARAAARAGRRPGPQRAAPSSSNSTAGSKLTQPSGVRRGHRDLAQRRGGRRARAADVDDRVERGGQLAVGGRPAPPGRQRERLDPGGDVDRGVGVEGAAAALVAGVERRQQVGHRGVAHLADDQPVGPHPQRLPHQVRTVDLTGALDVGRPRLQPDDVRDGRVAARWRPRPATSRSAGSTSDSRLASSVVLPAPVPPVTRKASRCAHQRRPAAGRPPSVTVPSSTRSARESDPGARDAQRQHRAGPRHRRQHRVEPACRRPAGRRRRGVASSSRRPPEAASRWASRRTASSSRNRSVGALQPGAPVEVDLVGTVDQHVGHARQPQQRLERTGADDVAAQRLVDREHGGVADRAAGAPQGGGDPVRGERPGLAGQPVADQVDQVGGRLASRGVLRGRRRRRPAPRGRRGPAGRAGSGPARARGRPTRRARAGRPSGPARDAVSTRPTSSSSRPGPRSTSAARRGSGSPATTRSVEVSPASVGRATTTHPVAARPAPRRAPRRAPAGRSTTTVSWPRWAADEHLAHGERLAAAAAGRRRR